MIRKPDSPFVADLHPSPNLEPRADGRKPTILLLHYTGLPDVEKAIEVLSRADCRVSCHYVVDVDGRVIQMVAEDMRAWHAGVSYWAGESDINSASIGIEVQNAGHGGGYPDFPEAQMRAVAALGRDIVARHRIRPERVLGHSDVAPARKIDPGEKFDWRSLAEAGVGLWVPPAPVAADDPGHGPGGSGPEVEEARQLLAGYGYGVALSGEFDEGLRLAIGAFQRHFRPERVDGQLDYSTADTLGRLVAARTEAAQLTA